VREQTGELEGKTLLSLKAVRKERETFFRVFAFGRERGAVRHPWRTMPRGGKGGVLVAP